MKLYEIDALLEKVLNENLDRETGEIREEALAEINAIEMDRDRRCLAIAA